MDIQKMNTVDVNKENVDMTLHIEQKQIELKPC